MLRKRNVDARPANNPSTHQPADIHHFLLENLLNFWLGLDLPRPKLSYQKINPCQNIYGKKRVKVRSTPATTLQQKKKTR